jgi:HPt (histidine-containing phosphotransfer) domain-containing protein
MQSEQLVYSELGGDPDLGELVEMFVDEMPDRISTLNELGDTKNWESLRRTAHQLKGSGGSYGFDVVSTHAARLEASCKTDDPVEDQILSLLGDLVDLCSRIRAGTP